MVIYNISKLNIFCVLIARGWCTKLRKICVRDQYIYVYKTYSTVNNENAFICVMSISGYSEFKYWVQKQYCRNITSTPPGK